MCVREREWPTFTHICLGLEGVALRTVAGVAARCVSAQAVLTQVSVHDALVHIWNTDAHAWRRRLRASHANVCRDTDRRRSSRWCPPQSPDYSYTCMFGACSRTRRSDRYQDPAHTRLYLTHRERFTSKHTHVNMHVKYMGEDFFLFFSFYCLIVYLNV